MSLSERSIRVNACFVCCIVMAAVLSGTRAHAQTGGSRFTMPVLPAIGRSYDAVKDFSIANNPNGPWSYGCSSSATEADFHAFAHGKISPTHKQLETWSGYKDTPYGTPGVSHSKAAETIRYVTITHPPDCLNLHPGPAGHRAIVRFTVPGRGTYKVQGTFKALDGTTTDPHVLVNGKEAVSIKPITGSHRREDFSFTQRFDRGDTIDFAVGTGGNGYGFDSTGLSVAVIPTTLAGAGIGVATEPNTGTAAGRKPPELVTLSANYGRQFKAMNAEGEERIKQLKAEYAVGLAALEKTAQAKGDLDAVLVVRAELARLGKGTEPSEEERAAMPSALAKQRSQYTEAISRYLTGLQEKQAQVQKLYLTDLEALERQLTQRGNIEGAMEVRREREQVTGRVSK